MFIRYRHYRWKTAKLAGEMVGLWSIVLAVASYTVVFSVSAHAAVSADQSAATIIMYHRFGEQDYPSTNIRIEQFEAHIRELQSGPYTVLPLEQIIEAYRAGRELPSHTVAITIDDAYRSVYTEAWPRLRDAKLPFTLFVATDPVDQGLANFLTWDQIREIKAAGGSIGHHTASHLHMVDASAEKIVQEIRMASGRYRKELGGVPKVFAYPYGEANLEVRSKIMEAGFTAAVGQHSGIAHGNSDRFYLPRFSFNEKFGSVDRLKMAATALPLPVTDITPRDFTLIENPPHFGFSVSQEIRPLGRLSCYASPGSGGPAQITRLGDRRVEVRIEKAFPAGRARFNCTLPTREGRWRWFGMQFYVP